MSAHHTPTYNHTTIQSYNHTTPPATHLTNTSYTTGTNEQESPSTSAMTDTYRSADQESWQQSHVSRPPKHQACTIQIYHLPTHPSTHQSGTTICYIPQPQPMDTPCICSARSQPPIRRPRQQHKQPILETSLHLRSTPPIPTTLQRSKSCKLQPYCTGTNISITLVY